MESKASRMFPGGIPGTLTIKDFAEALDINYATAKAYLDKEPGRLVYVNKAPRVPARVLYEFLGISSADSDRIESALK